MLKSKKKNKKPMRKKSKTYKQKGGYLYPSCYYNPYMGTPPMNIQMSPYDSYVGPSMGYPMGFPMGSSMGLPMGLPMGGPMFHGQSYGSPYMGSQMMPGFFQPGYASQYEGGMFYPQFPQSVQPTQAAQAALPATQVPVQDATQVPAQDATQVSAQVAAQAVPLQATQVATQPTTQAEPTKEYTVEDELSRQRQIKLKEKRQELENLKQVQEEAEINKLNFQIESKKKVINKLLKTPEIGSIKQPEIDFNSKLNYGSWYHSGNIPDNDVKGILNSYGKTGKTGVIFLRNMGGNFRLSILKPDLSIEHTDIMAGSQNNEQQIFNENMDIRQMLNWLKQTGYLGKLPSITAICTQSPDTHQIDKIGICPYFAPPNWIWTDRNRPMAEFNHVFKKSGIEWEGYGKGSYLIRNAIIKPREYIDLKAEKARTNVDSARTTLEQAKERKQLSTIRTEELQEELREVKDLIEQTEQEVKNAHSRLEESRKNKNQARQTGNTLLFEQSVVDVDDREREYMSIQRTLIDYQSELNRLKEEITYENNNISKVQEEVETAEQVLTEAKSKVPKTKIGEEYDDGAQEGDLILQYIDNSDNPQTLQLRIIGNIITVYDGNNFINTGVLKDEYDKLISILNSPEFNLLVNGVTLNNPIPVQD